MKRVLSLCCLSLFVCSLVGLEACQSSESPALLPSAWTTVYIVRHAEKQNKAPQSALTSVGTRRAQDLKRLLSHTTIHAVYTTPYRRTKDTARPTAKAQRRRLVLLPGKATKKLVTLLQTKHKGQSVLVVGHSNTIPAILRGLGVKDKSVTQAYTKYDELFVVTLRRGQLLRWQHLHYGPMPPKP